MASFVITTLWKVRINADASEGGIDSPVFSVGNVKMKMTLIQNLNNKFGLYLTCLSDLDDGDDVDETVSHKVRFSFTILNWKHPHLSIARTATALFSSQQNRLGFPSIAPSSDLLSFSKGYCTILNSTLNRLSAASSSSVNTISAIEKHVTISCDVKLYNCSSLNSNSNSLGIKYRSPLMKYLSKATSNDKQFFFDVKIVTNDRIEFNCHRVLLASHSEFFKNMLISGMKESNERIIHLEDVDSQLFKIVIEFLYKGEIEIFKSSSTSFNLPTVNLNTQEREVEVEENIEIACSAYLFAEKYLLVDLQEYLFKIISHANVNPWNTSILKIFVNISNTLLVANKNDKIMKFLYQSIVKIIIGVGYISSIWDDKYETRTRK